MRIPTLITLTTAVQAMPAIQASLPLPSRLVAQFPVPFWIENIAVRRNGALLLSQLTSSPPATLYTLPSPWLPSGSASPSPVQVHTFPNATALLGLAESALHPDLFVLVGGVNPTPNSTGSFSAWTVDFRHSGPAKITQIANLSANGVLLPNGVAPLPGRNAVLIADSFGGCVWGLDVTTGAVQLAARVPEMAAPKGGSVGINGVRVVGTALYWTNSGAAAVYRVGINGDGTPAEGAAVQTVAHLPAVFADDFAVGPNSRNGALLWVATNVNNTLVAVDGQAGKTAVVAGEMGSLALAGDTAAAFGRAEEDRGWLYVVTCGGARAPVNGTLTEGGKVVAVDTRGFVMPE